MRRRSFMAAVATALLARRATAGEPAPRFVFESIDGGVLDLAAFRDGPVLVVNTASRCGFTGQYEGLQALWERYRDRGLTVVGVPSASFRQELASAGEVKDFCEVNFAIDFPMTGLVDVTGADAHPFYAWAARQGVRPRWNFHKILLDRDGRIAADFGPVTGPSSRRLAAALERLLPPA